MNVEESGRNHQSCGVEDACVRIEPATDRTDLAFADEDIRGPVDLAGGVEDPAIPDEQVHQTPNIR